MAYVDLTNAYDKFKPRTQGLDFEAARKRREARLAQEQALSQASQESAFPTSEPEGIKKSLQEKILSFTGGNFLGRGLGLGLAQGGTKQVTDQIQADEGDMQQRLIQAIKKNQSEGKDTSRLVNALKQLTGGIENTGNTANDLYTEGITSKQVIGDAIQLAGTTATGYKGGTGRGQLLVKGKASAKAADLLGKVGVGATVAEKAVAPTTGILKGALAGAKTGAITGGAFGATTGLSQGLKNNQSVVDSLKQAGLGAVGGALTGGAIGGVLGGAGGALASRQVSKANASQTFVEDLVMPKATDKVKIQALQEGRVTEQGLLSASRILPSKRDIKVAEAVADVVNPKLSPAQNLNAISQKVEDINSGVKAYVKVNKTPFNTNQLRTQLNKGKDELNLIFASDAQAEKTYDAVVKEFMKRMTNKDTSGLLDVRQEFDKIPSIKKLLDSQGLGENTKKEVVLTVRNQANRYIASLLPKGNAYRETLLRESRMIEAMTNIAEKNSNTIGLNQLQALDKKYPILRYIVGSAVGAGGVGVGSTIIQSSN